MSPKQTILSEMFRLPGSSQRQVYYADIIIDMFKAQTKDMPPLV